MLDVAIRPCREDDLPALEWLGAFSHHRQIIRQAFELQLEDEVIMLVAEVGGDLIGQAWVDFRPRLGAHGPRVWAVRVLDDRQGAGVGRKLMQAAETLARARGCTCLELGVEKDNLPAQAFYARLGWRVVGELHETYDYETPDGEVAAQALDEWVLVKELAQAGAGRPTRA